MVACARSIKLSCALTYTSLDFCSCLFFQVILYRILRLLSFPQFPVIALRIRRPTLQWFHRNQLCGEIWSHLQMASLISGENYEALWSYTVKLARNSILLYNSDSMCRVHEMHGSFWPVITWHPCNFYCVSCYPSTSGQVSSMLQLAAHF